MGCAASATAPIGHPPTAFFEAAGRRDTETVSQPTSDEARDGEHPAQNYTTADQPNSDTSNGPGNVSIHTQEWFHDLSTAAVDDTTLASDDDDESDFRSSMASSTTAILTRNPLIGEYRLLNVIGRGAFGTVWTGFKQGGDVLVAIKVCERERQTGGRFRVEAEVLGKCHHPNIVKLVDVVEAGTSYSIVLEFLGGGPLFSDKEPQTLSEAILRCYFRQIFEGLRYLHDKKITHGDIKPENLVCDSTGTICKIIDFGSASINQTRPSRAFSTGTPGFAPPEATRGEYLSGQAADLWAAGLSLYQCATGKFPFDTSNPMQLAKDIERKEVTYPESMSPELKHLLAGLLHKDPQLRGNIAFALRHPWLAERTSAQVAPQLGAGSTLYDNDCVGFGSEDERSRSSPYPALVVDSNEIFRIFTSFLIATINPTNEKGVVHRASSGAEALEMCTRQHYRLILVELNMQPLSGVDLVVGIRQLEEAQRRPHSTIIGFTGGWDHPRNAFSGSLAPVACCCGFNDLYRSPLTGDLVMDIFVAYNFHRRAPQDYQRILDEDQGAAAARSMGLEIIEVDLVKQMCERRKRVPVEAPQFVSDAMSPKKPAHAAAAPREDFDNGSNSGWGSLFELVRQEASTVTVHNPTEGVGRLLNRIENARRQAKQLEEQSAKEKPTAPTAPPAADYGKCPAAPPLAPSLPTRVIGLSNPLETRGFSRSGAGGGGLGRTPLSLEPGDLAVPAAPLTPRGTGAGVEAGAGTEGRAGEGSAQASGGPEGDLSPTSKFDERSPYVGAEATTDTILHKVVELSETGGDWYLHCQTTEETRRWQFIRGASAPGEPPAAVELPILVTGTPVEAATASFPSPAEQASSSEVDPPSLLPGWQPTPPQTGNPGLRRTVPPSPVASPDARHPRPALQHARYAMERRAYDLCTRIPKTLLMPAMYTIVSHLIASRLETASGNTFPRLMQLFQRSRIYAQLTRQRHFDLADLRKAIELHFFEPIANALSMTRSTEYPGWSCASDVNQGAREHLEDAVSVCTNLSHVSSAMMRHIEAAMLVEDDHRVTEVIQLIDDSSAGSVFRGNAEVDSESSCEIIAVPPPVDKTGDTPLDRSAAAAATYEEAEDSDSQDSVSPVEEVTNVPPPPRDLEPLDEGVPPPLAPTTQLATGLFAAVFDGHGGPEASTFAATFLPGFFSEFLMAEEAKARDASDAPSRLEIITRAFELAFDQTHQKFKRLAKRANSDSGTTALCAYMEEGLLYLANAGDSAAVLYDVEDRRATVLNELHNTSNEQERRRMKQEKKMLMKMPNGDYRVNGVLKVTRALGSAPCEPQLSHLPEVQVVDVSKYVLPLSGSGVGRRPYEGLLILGSDGFWDAYGDDQLERLFEPAWEIKRMIDAESDSILALKAPSASASALGPASRLIGNNSNDSLSAGYPRSPALSVTPKKPPGAPNKTAPPGRNGSTTSLEGHVLLSTSQISLDARQLSLVSYLEGTAHSHSALPSPSQSTTDGQAALPSSAHSAPTQRVMPAQPKYKEVVSFLLTDACVGPHPPEDNMCCVFVVLDGSARAAKERDGAPRGGPPSLYRPPLPVSQSARPARPPSAPMARATTDPQLPAKNPRARVIG